MANFLGIKQVKLSSFTALTQEEKLGWFWLVNNEGVDANSTYDIYFGSRHYGSSSDKLAQRTDKFVENVQSVFGELMDSEGAFILPVEEGVEAPFASIDDSGVENLYDLLKAFDVALGKKIEGVDLSDYYKKSEIEAKVAALQAAIDKCLTGVAVKVGDDTFEGTIVDGVATIDLSDAFAAAGKVQDVEVDGVSVVEDGVAKISISGKADSAVVEAIGNRVAALEGADKASDVIYNEETKMINLVDADGNVLGDGFDASAFVVDGMLEDVQKGEKDGEFTFIFNINGEDGEKKSFTVDFSEFIDVYTAGDGIAIAENVVSFTGSTAEKIGVNEIPVGGTPLADILLSASTPVTSITADNLQAVLESLFSQNLWAENPRRNIPSSLTVKMDAPSISLDKTGTVEVGTTVNLSASAKTASASASITYSGFTYGYSMSDNDTKAGNTPSSVSITGTKNSDSDYKLTFVTNNGFGGVDVADVNGQSTSGNSLVVAEGTNKVTVTASSPTFSGTVPAQDKIYACSSLKKTDEEHVVAASESSSISGAVKTATANTSVSGAYYSFVGFADTLPINDGFRDAIDNGFTRFGKGAVAAGTCDKTYMFVCIPSGWDFTCNTSLGSDMRGSFTETGDATITLPNNETKAYKYYALTYKDGAFKDLVIK